MGAAAGLVAGTTFLASMLSSPGAVATSTTTEPTYAIGIRPASVSLVATAPPWRLPADARPYIAAAGLALHAGVPTGGFEVHLDIRADGHRVPVPAGVGEAILDGAVMGVSGLFTEDTSGVVHVVGDGTPPFTLGQVFEEWGVPFSVSQLGGYAAGPATRLVVTVNGKPVNDPAAVVLRPDEEIALWFGPATARPEAPHHYHFS